MGTMITLGIDKMEIDWGKNNGFRDHSPLFKPTDISSIPYYYYDFDTESHVIEYKDGYSRKLSSIKRRLDLLGYDIDSVRKMFNDIKSEHEVYGYSIKLSFDSFFEIFKTIDIRKMDTLGYMEKDGCSPDEYDWGEFVKRCVLQEPQIKDKIIIEYTEDADEWRSQEADLSSFFENLDPYILLRLLAEGPCQDLDVQWRFLDVVEAGWVERDEIVKDLPQDKRILIVTEGSSDSFVLKKTIDQLYPDISDFFDFVDMKENYPFTGVGNLFNFCSGLCKINIQNNIIVLFDNDTEALEKFEQSKSLTKPVSLLIIQLPYLEEVSKIKTKGPQGESFEDINGRASSIECFLDLKSISDEPCVRWKSYNEKLNQYQGALEFKEVYVKKFKKVNLLDGKYDTSKLRYLIEYIIQEWICRCD